MVVKSGSHKSQVRTGVERDAPLAYRSLPLSSLGNSLEVAHIHELPNNVETQLYIRCFSAIIRTHCISDQSKMPRYSSAQFYNDWRYSVKKDFTNPSTGETVKYAPDGFRTWGGEKYKLPFTKAIGDASVNCDGSLMAIPIGDDVHIYETENFTPVNILKGHIAKVIAVAFQPGHPKVLVSSSERDLKNPAIGEPTIIVWDLDKEQEHSVLGDGVIQNIAYHAKNTVVAELMQVRPKLQLSAKDQESLTSAIEPAIWRIIRTHAAANERTINGRLSTSFQSHVFSPSGSHLIYLPGGRPMSNGKDKWSINIYSMETHEDVLTLGGEEGAHTDAVMWTGYSPDETLIGTVAWDKTIRIWNAKTGAQKGKFYTNGQNWTGGFSPDSKRFASTCGDGTFFVYSLVDGTTLVEHKWSQSSWMRALDWGADSNLLAIGGEHGDAPARLILYDVDKKEILQERILSTEACVADPEQMPFLGHYLGCRMVKFLDGGRKLVVHTSGDFGIETYDLETWHKWRFTRPGIDPPFDDEAESDENEAGDVGDKGAQKKSTADTDFESKGADHLTVWEDKKKETIFFASMDGNAVRIWDIPMTKEKERETQS